MGDIIVRNQEVIIKLILAVIVGGFTGYEREKSNQFAGFRTHILVAIGSCITSIIALELFTKYSSISTMDPARLPAQVLSGIGFLGAGTIIQNGTDIKGLTTAATIWLCGGIGLACGSGYFSGAIIATIISLITLVLLVHLERHINQISPRIMIVVGSNSTNVLKDIMELANTFEVNIKDIRSNIVKDKKGNTTCHITLTLNKKSLDMLPAFAEELKLRLTPIDFKYYRKNKK